MIGLSKTKSQKREFKGISINLSSYKALAITYPITLNKYLIFSEYLSLFIKGIGNKE